MLGGRLWPRSDGEAEWNGAMQLGCAHMEQRVSLVTLGVSDLARARAFYEALGWTTRADPDDDVVFFRAGGMVVGMGRSDAARLDRLPGAALPALAGGGG